MTPDSTDHEYRGLLATHWDLLRGDTARWPDVTLCSELLPQNGSAVHPALCTSEPALGTALCKGAA